MIALPIGHLISMLILRWLANPMNNRYVRFVLDSYLEDIPNKLEKSRWFTPVTKEVDVEILDTNGNVESLLKGRMPCYYKLMFVHLWTKQVST